LWLVLLLLLENGNWGEWLQWGPCSVTCGKGGKKTRHRYCDSPVPKYGGAPCKGSSVEVKNCDEFEECPSMITKSLF